MPIAATTSATLTTAAPPEGTDRWIPEPPMTVTVRLAAQMASTAYYQAGQRVARLARQLLPQAAGPDDRMRLLFLYAAEETYLASVFPAANPTHPERWQAGVSEHRLAGELAWMIATAEEATATGAAYRPGGYEPETGPVVELMAYYVSVTDPVARGGLLDQLARHLTAQGYPRRAVEVLTDVAAALRITAISGNRPLPGIR
ncbi:hypothetical protein [Amycolatopsis sp. CA-126428]|uniref:hypothetical protein n=1 Tax=Amycolatopsis sp. CA-126428 TaxID=2073158 RepID=UPI000CD02D22|nr:hypothetical protein [Amycolatopsis sp. CA-126428]